MDLYENHFVFTPLIRLSVVLLDVITGMGSRIFWYYIYNVFGRGIW